MRRITPNTLPLLIIILAGKGGVGKTLLAQAIAELFHLNMAALKLFQLDDQKRLASSLKSDVQSVDLAILRRARSDPNALISAFSDFYASLELVKAKQSSVLIDIGATQQHAFLDYSSLTDLDDDLRVLGVRSLAFVPVLVDPESITQACRQLDRLSNILSSTQPVLVLNERDGSFEDLSPSSIAGQLYLKDLKPRAESLQTIRMPRIEGGSWQLFERHHARLLDVVGQDIPSLMAKTGLSRPLTKLARGDIAAWFGDIDLAIRALLAFGPET